MDNKIYITGAGPGEVELLTVKAYRCIEKADVILYDNLVPEEILALNPQAQKIYVGKKYGDHSDQVERQSNIHELMEHHWLKGKSVVRLKSGDPYIYGRAAEEARYLLEKGIPFEVIPGISAALGAASLLNIPLTERNKSNAVLICTAHTADYSFEQLHGVAQMLKAGNTIALYMGLKSLDKIISKLLEVCEDPDIVICAISQVSRKSQQLVSGTLGNIGQKIQESQLQMPVVFIIGAQPMKDTL